MCVFKKPKFIEDFNNFYFLLNVIPRLSINSTNLLIETLASILVGNKFDDFFIKNLISGISDPRNTFQILNWFGFDELATFIALQNNLKNEIEISLKKFKKKKIFNYIKKCEIWLMKNFKYKIILF